MMPIQGLMVSTVLMDRNNWWFSLFMVFAGVTTTVCIGAIFGAIMNDSLFTKENNSQVSSRINPALTDLLGALATGTVGAVALVRRFNHSPSLDLPLVWSGFRFHKHFVAIISVFLLYRVPTFDVHISNYLARAFASFDQS